MNTGQGIDRVDGRLKVTGAADYAADVAVERVAHALIVTSAEGRGRVEIDASAAEGCAGVLRVLTHKNAPKLPGALKKLGPIDRLQQVLQDDEVHYNDQPIAVVVAETLEQARVASQLLRVKYNKQALTLELMGALDSGYKPKTAGPRAEPDSERGDVARGQAAARVRIAQRYTTQNQHHNPMEMHATTAVWMGEDRLTVYDSTQGISNTQQKLAGVFGLPDDHVRVISHYVGGGFGCKGSSWSHVTLAAMAARVVGRPVKLVLTRQQMFGFVGYRPRTVQDVALAADAHGKLTAMEHHVVSETSRIDEFAEPSALTTRMIYACPNVKTTHRLVRLDISTPTFTRAPGEATGSFALESAMDELAYALDLDPLQLRLINHSDSDPDEKKPWSSKSLKACYKRAADSFGWSQRQRKPGSQRDGDTLIGWGMATATYPARQSPASAVARLAADGNVLVQAGTQDIGTGTYTIMTQLAADALGLPLARVRFELGDTSFPPTPVSGGSQTASSTGSAVVRACQALRAKLLSTATADRSSPLHGIDEHELELKDGVISARSRGQGQKLSFQELVARSGQPELSARVDLKPDPKQEKYSRHSFGAHFVEVRIPTDLSQLRVTRCVSAFAAGKILNSKTALSQYQGGMVWGIGLALLEHTVRDPHTGRAITRDLADYHVPVNADVPTLEVIMVDETDEYVNEIGAKGIGEIGITGMAAALANAVYHATGKRVRELPITIDKLRG